MQASRSSLGIYLGVFFVSCSTLFLQVLQTRVFSVMLWHHITYMVVTFTLLGFAASGTYLAVRSKKFEGDVAPKLSWIAILFALTTVLSFLTLSVVRLDTVGLLSNRLQYIWLFGYYIYLVIPYFLAGLTIAVALKSRAENSSRLYAINLLGSALGCLLFIKLLGPLGGSKGLVFAALLAAIGAVCFSTSSSGGGVRRVAIGVVVVLLASMPFAEKFLVIRPAPSKAMVERTENPDPALRAEIEYSAWDPLCRIDVLKEDKYGGRMIYQDADAPTFMPAAEDLASYQTSIYSLAHHLQDHPKALVIGVGGGNDLWHAYLNGCESVTGAEINPTTAAMMRDRYRDLSQGIYDHPGDQEARRGPVEVVVAEGRSFIRQSDTKYDLIQMTGTDTYTALSSGAYVMSESYLYTVEAFQDYLDHLEDGGMIAVLRFRFYPPRESLRLVAIASTAMRSRGIEAPSECIAVVSMKLFVEEKNLTVPYAVMLFRKGGFEQREVDILKQFVSLKPDVYTLSYAPGEENPEEDFRLFFEAERQGGDALEEFIDAHAYNISPTYDDNPFFFRFHRWSSLWEDEPTASAEGEGTKPKGGTDEAWFGAIGGDPVGLYILTTALVETTLLVALLVLLPLWVFKRGGLKVSGKLPVFLFFFGIGLGFMFLEIAAMQRFVLYLGHPVYSITVVLATFLTFSGLGSSVCGRFLDRGKSPVRIAIPIIVALVILYAVILPDIFHATLGWSTTGRVALSVALLGVPAFFMGMPFPSGLKIAHQRGGNLVPWAWGINGGASVIATVVAIILAMATGFSVVFLCAAVFYGIAWLAVLPLTRASSA